MLVDYPKQLLEEFWKLQMTHSHLQSHHYLHPALIMLTLLYPSFFTDSLPLPEFILKIIQFLTFGENLLKTYHRSSSGCHDGHSSFWILRVFPDHYPSAYVNFRYRSQVQCRNHTEEILLAFSLFFFTSNLFLFLPFGHIGCHCNGKQWRIVFSYTH